MLIWVDLTWPTMTCVCMLYAYVCMHTYQWPVFKNTPKGIFENSQKKSSKQTFTRNPGQKAGKSRSFYCAHTIELRLEARLCHVVLRARLCSVSIFNWFAHDPLLKKLGHFQCLSSISPSRPASPPPPPRPRAQRCAGASLLLPSLCFARTPLLSPAVPLVDQPTRCFGSVQQEDRPAAICHS